MVVMNMSLGKNISSLRKKHKLTQEELAKRIDISRAALSHYEKDRREPDIETIKKIADYFGVTVDLLMDGISEIEREKIKSILGKEIPMEDFSYTHDGKTYDLEQLLEYLKDKPLAWGKNTLEGEDKRKALDILRALFDKGSH